MLAFGTSAVVTRRTATQRAWEHAARAEQSIPALVGREAAALRTVAALIASDPELRSGRAQALIEGRWPHLTLDLLAIRSDTGASAVGLDPALVPFGMGPGPELHRIDGGVWLVVSEDLPGSSGGVVAGRRVEGDFLAALAQTVAADLAISMDGRLAADSVRVASAGGALLALAPGAGLIDGQPVVVSSLDFPASVRWVIAVPVEDGAGIAASAAVALGALVLGCLAFALFPEPRPGPSSAPPSPSRTPAPRVDDLVMRRTQQLASARRNEVMLERTLSRLALELRTALTGVIGYSELLKEEAQRDQRWQAASDVDRVLVGARDAMDLVQDTLALVDMVRGKLEREPAAFQLGTLVHDVVSNLRPTAGSYGTRIEVEGGELGSVYTDRVRLRHVIRNLVGRALNASVGGTVRVRVQREGSADQPWIRLDVLDDGPALTPEQLSRIFAVASEEASDPAGPGSSVRLLVARRFATFLGGDLTATAPPGGGTCLTLRVPARVEPAAVQVALRSSMTPGPGVDRR